MYRGGENNWTRDSFDLVLCRGVRMLYVFRVVLSTGNDFSCPFCVKIRCGYLSLISSTRGLLFQTVVCI